MSSDRIALAALSIMGLLIVLVVWKLWQALENEKTNIEWYHLISSQGRDGKQYASATKVCMLVTFFVSTMLVTWIVFQVHWAERAVEVVGLIGAWLVYGAGVEIYAKHLRSGAAKEQADDK